MSSNACNGGGDRCCVSCVGVGDVTLGAVSGVLGGVKVNSDVFDERDLGGVRGGGGARMTRVVDLSTSASLFSRSMSGMPSWVRIPGIDTMRAFKSPLTIPTALSLSSLP